MTRICFLDTETTSLRHDRRPWDVAVIVRDPGQPDEEHQWFVDAEDLDLGNADLKSLQVGRFYERHPAYRGPSEPTAGLRVGRTMRESAAMRRVETLTRGAVLIGAVPSFDADVLGQRLRAHGLGPAWHYRPLCVETLALGWIAGLRAAGGGENGHAADLPTLPWPKSEELSLALGVEPAIGDQRHSAIGDARWARDLFDAATDGAYLPRAA